MRYIVPVRNNRLVFIAILVLACVGSAGLVGCAERDGIEPPIFDRARAFGLLKRQVDLGPRCPGSEGHSKGAEVIVNALKPYADSVRTQDFTLKLDGRDVKLKNIVAHFNPKARRWVLLAAHWDTRPIADYEVIAENRKRPIPGANDGASGVAVLLELARLFKERAPKVGVVMVFFDCEDYPGSMFAGSKRFAEALPESASLDGKPIRIDYGILLDMVGDKDLRIPKEGESRKNAPDLVDTIWKTARELGYERHFPNEFGSSIHDDHIELIKAGVKCVDLIDFDYGPWHTLGDTVDKCSAESLGVVGEVVARVIYSEKENPGD